MTTDQADMLLDAYWQARLRRLELARRSGAGGDVEKADRDEARDDFYRARLALVNYLRQVEFRP